MSSLLIFDFSFRGLYLDHFQSQIDRDWLNEIFELFHNSSCRPIRVQCFMVTFELRLHLFGEKTDAKCIIFLQRSILDIKM